MRHEAGHGVILRLFGRHQPDDHRNDRCVHGVAVGDLLPDHRAPSTPPSVVLQNLKIRSFYESRLSLQLTFCEMHVHKQIA